MAVRERSLRNVVAFWLGVDGPGGVRVTRFGRAHNKLWRYVCVEALREQSTFTIVLFRHADGSWCVFPPAPYRPVMGALLNAGNAATMTDDVKAGAIRMLN